MVDKHLKVIEQLRLTIEDNAYAAMKEKRCAERRLDREINSLNRTRLELRRVRLENTRLKRKLRKKQERNPAKINEICIATKLTASQVPVKENLTDGQESNAKLLEQSREMQPIDTSIKERRREEIKRKLDVLVSKQKAIQDRVSKAPVLAPSAPIWQAEASMAIAEALSAELETKIIGGNAKFPAEVAHQQMPIDKQTSNIHLLQYQPAPPPPPPGPTFSADENVQRALLSGVFYRKQHFLRAIQCAACRQYVDRACNNMIVGGRCQFGAHCSYLHPVCTVECRERSCAQIACPFAHYSSQDQGGFRCRKCNHKRK